MRQTVLGVFESYADARSAQRALGEAGVTQADIAIYSMSIDAPVEKGPRVYAPGNGDVRHHNPVFDQLEQLFARLFKSGKYPAETEDYRELIRRGGAIVSADVSETQVDMVRDLMRRTGAADIEERAKAWQSGYEEAGIAEQALHRGSSTTRDTSPVAAAQRASAREDRAAAATTMQDTTFSSAGQKMVGGMQQVTTRSDGFGSNAPLENRQQLSGVPDAGFTSTPETLERLDASVNARAAYPTADSLRGTQSGRVSGAGLVGDPLMGTPLEDALYDDEFREDYNAHYASTGASYDEYQRAYTHGATLAQDERYRGNDWQRVEANARENWESRYPESGWERFKAAVRHGWDRVTGG